MLENKTFAIRPHCNEATIAIRSCSAAPLGVVSLNAACENLCFCCRSRCMSQSQKSLAAAAGSSSSRTEPLPLSSPMLFLFLLLLVFGSFHPTVSLVVPHDLPTVLSVIYSNIPEIKKGTDSRLGFGFRLGDHADFQILFELGPQTYTQPIGDQGGKSSTSFNKRQVTKKEYLKALWRQHQLQEQKVQKEEEEEVEEESKASTEQSPSSWLQNWSNGMNNDESKETTTTTTRSGQRSKQLVLLPMMPNVPEQVLKQLQLLHQMATTTTTNPILKPENNTTTLKPLTQSSLLQLDKLLRLSSKEQAAATASLGLPAELQDANGPKDERKTKHEITKELMDVNLEEE